MSTVGPFDTLKFSTRLKEGGFTQEQAEVLTLSIQEALTEAVATKADLKAETQAIKVELLAKINTTQNTLIGAIVAAVMTLSAITFGMLHYFSPQ